MRCLLWGSSFDSGLLAIEFLELSSWFVAGLRLMAEAPSSEGDCGTWKREHLERKALDLCVCARCSAVRVLSLPPSSSILGPQLWSPVLGPLNS